MLMGIDILDILTGLIPTMLHPMVYYGTTTYVKLDAIDNKDERQPLNTQWIILSIRRWYVYEIIKKFQLKDLNT